MEMSFYFSSSVMLLFDFWNVHSPAGMVLSVFIVFLLTIFYELLKVWRLWLGRNFQLEGAQSADASAAAASGCSECSSVGSSPSEISLTTRESQPQAGCSRNSWLLHVVQTVLHMMQVTLGYMLMLCVMSYNTWIFLGIIVGAVLGYFISFPLLDQMSYYGLVKQ